MACSSLPCQNSASCVEQSYGYSCDCLPGYGGTNCEYGL